MFACVFLFLSITVWATPRSPTHRALLVGVTNYDSDPWKALPLVNSETDLDVMETMLRKRGFKNQAIQRIPNEEVLQPTALAIRTALETLVEETQSGDVIVFYYTGHGSQLKDQGTDEPDGRDEALVASNAGDPDDEIPTGFIRDDELGEILVELRRKAGPEGHVWWIIDSCFSGSATRSLGLEPKSVLREPIEFEGRPRGRDNPTGLDLPMTSQDGLAPFIVLSASRYDELARVTESTGLDGTREKISKLTRELGKIMIQGRSLVYRELHEQLSEKTKKYQHPQIEGEVSLMVLGQETIDLDSLLEFKETVQDGVLDLEIGELQGVYTGALVEVHKGNAFHPDPSTLLARGQVTSSSALISEVTLEKPLSVNPEEHRVFITQRTLADRRLPIKTPPEATTLREIIAATAELRLEEEWAEVEIVETEAGYDLVGLDVGIDPLPNIGEMVRRLQRYALAERVRDLDLYSSRVQVELTAVPCDSKQVEAKRFQNEQGIVQIPIELQFCLEVKNLSEEMIRFSVVAIDRQDRVFQVYPPPGTSPDALGIGRTVELSGAYRHGHAELLSLVDRETGQGDQVRLFAFPAQKEYRPEGMKYHDGPEPPDFSYEARMTQNLERSITRSAVNDHPAVYDGGTSVTLELEFFDPEVSP